MNGPEGKQAVTIEFKDWEQMAKKLAYQFRRQVATRGHQITWDEAYSEVCMRWVMARKGFKPELGFSFATYFTRAVINWVKPFLLGRKDEMAEAHGLHINEQFDNGDGGMSLQIADDAVRSPEQIVSSKEGMALLSRKTPLIEHMLGLMREPPDELLAELEAAQAQRRYAKQLGVPCYENAATQLTPKIMGRIFRFNWKQRLRLTQEIEEALAYV